MAKRLNQLTTRSSPLVTRTARSGANAAIAAQRLRNQRLTLAGFRRAADVVGWFGAMQAQEYEPAKWALGLRMREGTLAAEIERAFEQGEILRTHVMRPTWHFVTPADIRWLTELTAPRVRRMMAVYHRRLELDTRIFVRSTALIEKALGDGATLTRTELGERLRSAGLMFTGERLGHLAMYAELEGVICSGPRRGKKFTYALVAQRAPGAPRFSRDESLATLARRYFSSHGPATIRDFVWWSGLTTADARRGLEMINAHREDGGDTTYWTVGSPPRGATRDHLAHLLPVYDEYLVAYRDRHAVPHGPSTIARGSSASPSVTFQHALIIGGQVAGTWRRMQKSKTMAVDVVPVRPLTRPERHALEEATGRYERFLSTPVDVSIR